MYADLHPQAPDANVFKKYMEAFPSPASPAGILCTDSGRVRKNVDEFTQFVHNVSSYSPTGEEFSFLPWQCSKWEITPIERYTGPWSVTAGLKQTRFPILYTSLDADPVTPLSAAIRMVEAFGNKSAALLVQHGFGHATIAHPSLCTAKAVHDYFVVGKLPSPGTICQPEPGYLFPAPTNGSARTENLIVMSEGDGALLDAFERLGEGLIEKQRQQPLGAFSIF
ncbi:hypothetical protein FS749_006806 [Ceratobasidium sp. UAMH 11750]|nr:hypothetical protein FS749_006806 [Ceratobasidium sp. UAMH 11750]